MITTITTTTTCVMKQLPLASHPCSRRPKTLALIPMHSYEYWRQVQLRVLVWTSNNILADWCTWRDSGEGFEEHVGHINNENNHPNLNYPHLCTNQYTKIQKSFAWAQGHKSFPSKTATPLYKPVCTGPLWCRKAANWSSDGAAPAVRR